MKKLKEEDKETSPLSGKPHGIKKVFRQVVPYGFCQEAKKLLGLAMPVFLSEVMIFLVVIVNSALCGHLGKVELDSVMFASTVINIAGVAVGYGLSTSCDTLISQTYGSKNLKRVGTIVQRGILIVLLCCFPCSAILMNTEQILLLCKQNPEIARLTQKYVMIFLPGLPGIIWPQFFAGVAGNIVNAVVLAVLMHVLKMGMEGSAWANTISQWTMLIFLFSYIVVKKVYVETWGGWSKDCLQEWDIFFRLAILSMLMLCVEWWSFEIGVFLAGLLNVVELGGQVIMWELILLATSLPVGFGMAANVRIGNGLGAGDIEQAKRSCKVVLSCTVIGCLFVSGITLASKNVIGYVFTNDKDIVALVSKLMLLFAPIYLFYGISIACSGILQGMGKQKIGAITNIVGYYVIGIPVGLVLMFPGKLGVIGLWTGMFLPLLLQICIFIPYMFSVNWYKVCEEARIIAGVKPLEVPDPQVSQTDIVKAQMGLVENGNSTMADSNSIELHDMASDEDHTKQLELQNLPTKTTNVVGEMLSNKQLIVRRGSALLLSISTLIIGIIVKVMTSKK